MVIAVFAANMSGVWLFNKLHWLVMAYALASVYYEPVKEYSRVRVRGKSWNSIRASSSRSRTHAVCLLKTMLITFSGLDGSGKSTLVDYLKDSLELENRKVAVAHMNYDLGVYSAMRFIVKKVSGVDGNEQSRARVKSACKWLSN